MFRKKAVNKLNLEPTLIPKVQVQSGDFPYLHYSIRSRVYHSGDLMRYRVRSPPRNTDKSVSPNTNFTSNPIEQRTTTKMFVVFRDSNSAFLNLMQIPRAISQTPRKVADVNPLYRYEGSVPCSKGPMILGFSVASTISRLAVPEY